MYDDATRHAALALVKRGLTPLQASRAMGGKPSKTTIRLWLSGVTPVGRRSARKQRPYEEKIAALERVEAGEDYRVVAKDLECAPSTLLTWRKKYLQHGPDGVKTFWDLRAELERKAREKS